ncbi:hypothetical protein BDR04DRAFT_1071309 [Suillus decipiens]|nr:hypothetical protein BDR04DRAFT_1071309 [Suillus decipiens]
MTVRLWDVATGQQVGEPLWGHTDLVLSVSFSPDGTRIVTGSWDKTVRLWDVATGQQVGEPFSAPFVLNVGSGWVSGPKRRLLFWVPPASQRPFYSPGTALVIPRCCELDLSRMTHGQHWQKCRAR